MSDALPPPPAAGRSNRTVAFVVIGAVVVLGIAFLAWLVTAVRDAIEVPSFPSVAEQPDPTVTGTAVFDDYDCLRAVPLAGGEPVEITCDKDTAVMLVSSARFLDSGELEVVIVTEGGSERRMVFAFDGSTVREVSDEVLDEPVEPAAAPAGPGGEMARSVNEDGTVQVVVSGPEGERTLLSAEGGETYGLGEPLWVPDGSALVLHDAADRLLLVTTDEQPTTRVLQEDAAQVWAVTDQDLLTGG